ncbi:MAG: SpoVA/SpoVAEb family sporulation membrane protein [Bacillota bacterium]|nr:SpoVA/SpoVAEb family sporulation membrane protein [Bacillota bacterium]
MQYLIAFVVGGLVGAIGQIIFDTTKLTMGQLMVAFVIAGSLLTGLGLYEPFVKWAGAGAFIPVSNFGFVLTKGVLEGAKAGGLYGALSGVFTLAGGPVATAIFFGFVFALFFRPRG